MFVWGEMAIEVDSHLARFLKSDRSNSWKVVSLKLTNLSLNLQILCSMVINVIS